MRPLLLLASLIAVAAPARADDDFAAMKRERIGGLGIGMPAAAVVKALGQPTKKGKIQREEADGGYAQTWTYASQGVEVEMGAAKKAGPQVVSSITVTAPATLKTSKGIGIASTAAELGKAYAADRNAEESNADSFVVGSIYGGVIFQLTGGKVSRIFLGAAAE